MSTTPSDQRQTLPKSLPQFGLRGMFVAVAICGLLFSAIRYLGFYWVAILSLGALAVVVHIAATWIGSRMRTHSGFADETDGSAASQAQPRKRPTEFDFAPITKLYQRHALGLPVIVLSTLGCVAGIAAPWLMQQTGLLPGTEQVEICVGSIAFGLLGGIGTFLTTSFCWVGLSAWRQASASSKR